MSVETGHRALAGAGMPPGLAAAAGPDPIIPDALRPAFDQADRHDPFLGPEWFENLLRTTVAAPRQSVRLYSHGTAGQPAQAVLPMRISRRGLPPGHRIEGLSNFYSPVFGPVTDYAAPDLESRVRGLIGRITAEPWAVIDLHPLEEPLAILISGAFRTAGWLQQRYLSFGNWHLQLDGMGFTEYMASRPARLRNTVLRKSRRFRAAGGTLEIASAPHELRPLVDDFRRVYGRSWKKPEPFPDFIPGLVESFGARGRIRLGVARLGGSPAAAQIWILANGVAYIYKLAHDETLAGYSPGSVLTASMMEHAIDQDRVGAVDFLMGDEPYKRDWMSHRRERYGLLAFDPRRAAGVASALRHIGGRRLARALRVLAGRPRPAREDA
jgi:hypothetical protein